MASKSRDHISTTWLRGRRLAICVGPIRTGTTWLFETLRRHPEVAASVGKEVDFFNLNLHRGLDWYARRFAPTLPATRLLLDVSPHYFDLDDIAERIGRIFADPIIVVGIRNPYDRVVSDYRRHFSAYPFRVMIEDEEAWERCRLANLIAVRTERLFARFGRENVIVYNFDELMESPRCLCERLCTCLGIAPFVPPHVERKIFDSAAPRNRTILALVRGTRRVVARVAPRVADDLMFSRLRALVYSGRKDGTITEGDREAVFARCEPFFEEEIGRLEALLGADLSGWRRSSAKGRAAGVP